MNRKHTPGPWHPEVTNEPTRGKWFMDATGDLIALAVIRKDKDEEDANARLIQAAPEMYELLNLLLDSTDDSYVFERSLALLNKINQP